MTDILSRLKAIAKRTLIPGSSAKIVTEFDKTTLPWVDKEGADIDGFVKGYARGKGLPYDLAEKMKFWKNGNFL